MGKYYILSIDSFIDTFTIMDATKNMTFSLEMKNNKHIFKQIQPGDKLLIYRRKPISRINVCMEVDCKKDDKIGLIKKLEVANGIEFLKIGLDNKLEEEVLINIDKVKFTEICELMIQSFTNVIKEKNVTSNIPRMTKAENILLYGVPGVGKSHEIQKNYCNDATKIERVVFHPDYSYSDFVGQILPRVVDEQLKYVFTPGPFTQMLKKAWCDPGNKYYLIIEEINRGNAPAIFGEIFQLLDRKTEDNDNKYDPHEYGESEYAIANYDVAKEVYGDQNHDVRIPSNMWILATMNTADQNVFTLDTAFQRRWNMKHIKNDVLSANHAKDKIEGSDIEWGVFASVINDMIVDNSFDIVTSEDKRLGAYFVNKNELVVSKFPEKVLKYLWDDAFKMNREMIFNERFKSLENVIETYEETTEDKLLAVLKSEVYQKMNTQMKNHLEND